MQISHEHRDLHEIPARVHDRRVVDTQESVDGIEDVIADPPSEQADRRRRDQVCPGDHPVRIPDQLFKRGERLGIEDQVVCTPGATLIQFVECLTEQWRMRTQSGNDDAKASRLPIGLVTHIS